jgi:hypothetical protein
MTFGWSQDKVNHEYRPTLYPGEETDSWEVPEGISGDFHRLNSIIEGKYSREFLKICAFFNKMFPSLKSSAYAQSSYNVPPFTSMEQERGDTGYGTNYNYLKQIVDQITSRLGTISFVPRLMSEEQSYEYVVYKDEVERMLRKFIKHDDLTRISIEAFHNASIVGYSHAFIDPFTGRMVKANDYEVGIYESQFNRRHVKQMLYRDYAFPVSDVFVYIKELPGKQASELLEGLADRSSVEFSMFFDCIRHEVFVTIAGKTLPARAYPFDEVLMCSFTWDTSFSRQLTSSMFDLLYPIQREINRIAAKKQQIIRMYKGAVPVFNSDVDIALKSITNGAGEALYIDSSRSATELMTVINPTPLDPQLDAEIQSHKTTMYELAGIQNASFDMENMRSAAAVVALDQTRDSVFQAQMAGMSQFIKDMLVLYIRFLSKYPDMAGDCRQVDWEMVSSLIDQCYINMQPVHLNDPLSDEQKAEEHPEDYSKLASSRLLLGILKGDITFGSLPYFVNPPDMILAVGTVLIKFEALGIDIPPAVHKFLMDAYVAEVKAGNIKL